MLVDAVLPEIQRGWYRLAPKAIDASKMRRAVPILALPVLFV